ncbi:MAG: sigma-54-dependent Fis family transcriptional regulator [Geobacter sp.]|nr:MAG: sigma-54-dependent Fis family transcriptional regulator [Geobacter sp.]
MTRQTILVVDDESISLQIMERYLQTDGFLVITATCGSEALEILNQHTSVDMVITDLLMPGMDGIQLIEQIRCQFDNIPVIAITASGSIQSAITAIKSGASDYLEKPCSREALRIAMQRTLNYHDTIRENEQLRQLLRERFTFHSIVTVNPSMKGQLELAARVVHANTTTVAIYGESGVGKEVLARAIHFAGKGLPNSFIAVNCAAIPEHLLESELFGHVRGSFTGADRDREGKLSAAKGGTLLLDEIGDMPLSLQAKLLRVLQEHVYEKIGSNNLLPVECRVIVTTNRNLPELVTAGRFREDLFHRINIFPLTIPPLRERREDIPHLCEHVLDQLRQHLGKPLPGISKKTMELLQNYHWPGNVRELRNMLERAAILTDNELIRPSHFSIFAANTAHAAAVDSGDMVCYNLRLPTAELSLEALTTQILAVTLERCNDNKSKAAKLLKIARKNFYRS